jgi:hypothetical protein
MRDVFYFYCCSKITILWRAIFIDFSKMHTSGVMSILFAVAVGVSSCLPID